MKEVNEKSTRDIGVTFRDKNGALTVPSAISYRLDDVDSGTSIRGPTSVTPASSIEITLTSADNAMVDATKRSEIHELTVTATFGASGQSVFSFDFKVRNLRFQS
jgi:hypothetical protein